MICHISPESVVSVMHEQSIICSITNLGSTTHEQTIICRQLFAGRSHDGFSANGKEEKNALNDIIIYFD